MFHNQYSDNVTSTDNRSKKNAEDVAQDIADEIPDSMVDGRLRVKTDLGGRDYNTNAQERGASVIFTTPTRKNVKITVIVSPVGTAEFAEYDGTIRAQIQVFSADGSEHGPVETAVTPLDQSGRLPSKVISILQSSYDGLVSSRTSHTRPFESKQARKELKQELIKIGSQHPDLQDNIRPVLDHLDRTSSSNKTSVDSSDADFKMMSSRDLFDVMEQLERMVGTETLIRNFWNSMPGQSCKNIAEGLARDYNMPDLEARIDDMRPTEVKREIDLCEDIFYGNEEKCLEELAQGMGSIDLQKRLYETAKLRDLDGLAQRLTKDNPRAY